VKALFRVDCAKMRSFRLCFFGLCTSLVCLGAHGLQQGVSTGKPGTLQAGKPVTVNVEFDVPAYGEHSVMPIIDDAVTSESRLNEMQLRLKKSA